MSIFVLVDGSCGTNAIYAVLRGVRSGLFTPAICNDSTSDGPHCKIKFKG